MRLRGFAAFLLLDAQGGEFLTAFLGLLPVLPFGFALGKPVGGFGRNCGLCVSGLHASGLRMYCQRFLEFGVEFGLLGEDFLVRLGCFVQAQFSALRRLLQELLLIDRVEEVLLGFGGGLAGGVDGLLALLGGLQAFAQAVQGLFGRISRGDERFCILPGVDRKCVAGQCRNEGLPFIGDAFEFLVDAGLLLEAFFLGGFGGGFFVAGLLSGLYQLVEFGLFFGERGFGGGDIQRRVVGDCRVFVCAAERAGFAGL